MAEDDWDGREYLTAKLGRRVQLVGDDLFVTNTEILRQGIGRSVANSILVKPDQIGTLTKTLAAIEMADAAGYATVVSHRSGETEDTTIADLSVCTSASHIKTSSLCRSDRVAKNNRPLLIEQGLGQAVPYPAVRPFASKGWFIAAIVLQVAGFGAPLRRSAVGRSRWPRTAASRRRRPQEVDPSVGQLWRNATGRFGSGPRVRAVEKLSPMRREPPRGGSTTAVPRTADVRARACPSA